MTEIEADLTLSLAEAQDYVVKALIERKTSEPNARSVATALVSAEADGLRGHGLTRLTSYAAQSESGKVDGFAVPTEEDRAPTIIAIDAGNGFAYPALDLALSRLPNRARVFGMAAAPIRKSHHCGAVGQVVENLARSGFAAIMFANAPHCIAPWGGSEAVFGTNPIAFAAPTAGDDPIVIDLSVSKVARGNILKAANEGTPIPEGWALSKAGQPTTDAKEALDGTMIAMGGAKGTALALMVEIFSGALTMANFSFQATSFFTGEGDPPGTGQFVLAFDPEAFAGTEYKAKLSELTDRITSQDGARLPGMRRFESRRKAEHDGITLPRDVRAKFGDPD
ncbi:MAG: Ldh family oxidoreductase [Pseudomonadota bacterium]